MPLTICAEIRDGSRRATTVVWWASTSWKPKAETIVKRPGADRDERVRPQAGLVLAKLALDADQAAEQRGQCEPEQRLLPADRRHGDRREQHEHAVALRAPRNVSFW